MLNLKLDIVMVQNNFHPISKLSFQFIELLLTVLQFSRTKNNGKIITRGSKSC